MNKHKENKDMKKEFEKRTCKGNDNINLIYTKYQFNLYYRV